MECVFGGLVYSDSLHIIKKKPTWTHISYLSLASVHISVNYEGLNILRDLFKKKCIIDVGKVLAQEEANLHPLILRV